MVIRQGDVFWITLSEPSGSSPGYRHPHVVVQNNLFNDSRIQTVIVCTITSNQKRGGAPGNVTLEKGEGGLAKASVAVVSQLFTIDKSDLTEHIGTLSKARVRQILEGIRLLTDPREAE